MNSSREVKLTSYEPSSHVDNRLPKRLIDFFPHHVTFSAMH